jgi:hypothetical protein
VSDSGFDLVAVGVAAEDHRLGNAVGAEDEMGVFRTFKARQCFIDPLHK